MQATAPKISVTKDLVSMAVANILITIHITILITCDSAVLCGIY